MVVVGKTGSGKSTLALGIYSRWDRVLVFNPKGEADPLVMSMPNAVIARTAADALRAIPGRVIYAPSRDELRDAPALFDRLVDKIWKIGGHHGLALHELLDLVDAGELAPALKEAFYKGRAHRIPIVSCVPEIANLPLIVPRSAEHYFCLYLVDDVQRQAVSRYMGPRVREERPPTFNFWYRGPGMAAAVRCPAFA